MYVVNRIRKEVEKDILQKSISSFEGLLRLLL